MSRPDYLIREYRAEDEPRLAECFIELQDYETTLDEHLADAREVVGTYLPYLFKQCAETEGAVFVAESHEDVVGFVSVWSRVQSRSPEEREYEYAYVSDLVVLKEHRGLGIGRALLARAEEHARAKGATLLRIYVLAGNDGAHSLYRSQGFRDRLVGLDKKL